MVWPLRRLPWAARRWGRRRLKAEAAGDRMAAEAPSWVAGRTAAEAATKGPLLAAPTAWDPVPMRSTAGGMSIVARTRIGTVITSTPIGTAITGPTRRTVALAGGGLQRGACGCAATSARPMDIGTATLSRTIGRAIIAPTADIPPALFVRPSGGVPPTDTERRQGLGWRGKGRPSKSPAPRGGGA